jgi:hypothetical protein
MKWLVFSGLVSALAIGCGGNGGGDTPDAGPDLPNPGFVTPSEPTVAWSRQDGVWVEQGPADWSCLNTPSDDVATSDAVVVNGRIRDFQNSGDAVPNATISAFDGVELDNPFTTVTGDGTGEFTLTIPAGTTRFGYKMSASGWLDTFLLNQYYESDPATQNHTINAVSELTANALPAFIGVTRTPGLGVVAGAIRDCQDREVSGAIATMSNVSGSADHIDGAETYYFSAGSSSLPVRHSQALTTNKDGLFVIIELPVVSGTAYLQVWGFTPDQNPATDELTLLAEVPSPVLGDTVITASIEPLRSN